jgi:hypothetical protein
MRGDFASIRLRRAFLFRSVPDGRNARRLLSFLPRGIRPLAPFAAAAVLVFASLTVSQPALADWTLYVDWDGPGSVTVASSDGGSFDCSAANCTATYPDAIGVTLTPHATAAFLTWDTAGPCIGGTGVCHLSHSNGPLARATAIFQYKLRLNFFPFQGSVQITASDSDPLSAKCSFSGCTYMYLGGTTLTLTALPHSNDAFTGWDGACSGTASTCDIVMSTDQTVGASFTTLTYPLQVNILGDGNPGTITSFPSGISCPPTCNASFDNGQSVTLSASANTGYTFGAWGDPPCSGSGLCIVAMNSSQSVDGLFEVKTTTKVTTKPATAKPGQAVKFTAMVKPVPAIGVNLPGSVTFKEGAKTLGRANLSSGSASLSLSNLAIGSHSISAQYSSGSIFYVNSSGAGTVKITPVFKSEARVNTFTKSAQQFPAVARLKGGYMVVWASNTQDGNGYGIYGQRYTVKDAKVGGELHISTATKGNQSMPKVAGLTAGGFVVVWQSDKQDGNTSGIYAQAFTAAGARSGSEFKVNTTSAGAQTQPAIVALTGGGFVVAWTSAGQDGRGLGVYAQLYDAHAKAIGKEFKVNTTTAGDQSAPSLAATKDGGFVAVWQSPDANGLGIFGQRYASSGKTVGKQFPVNTTPAKDQSLPSAAGLSDGSFVVVWQSNLQDKSKLGVYAQRFTSKGAKSGGEVMVNSYTPGDQGQPQVAAFSDGGFVVLWTSNLQDSFGKGVYAQVFSGTGAPFNVEFQVNTTVLKDQWQPAVAAAGGGLFMAAWTSRDQDGSLEGIYNGMFVVP